MRHINELTASLSPYIKLSRHRLECLCHFIFALLSIQDVTLAKVAQTFCSDSQVSSHYKRLQRFLKYSTFRFEWLWFLIQNIFDLPDQLMLTMDRTNWQFGRTPINILFIGIAYKGLSIPLIWCFIDSKGNSHSTCRIALVKKLLCYFPKARIARLLADREFMGEKWLTYLHEQKISFSIRTRENITVSNTKGVMLPAKIMMRNIKPGKSVCLLRKRKTMGLCLYIAAARLNDGALLILLTDKEPEEALNDYLMRWEIETFFAALKRRGFNFENTHVTQHERLNNLVFVLAIAFMCAYKMGEHIEQERPAKLKKHGYKQHSFFKRGLSALAHAIHNLHRSVKTLLLAIRFIFNQGHKNQRLQGGVL